MEIQGRTILILGGSGLVGMAVARALLPHRPARLVISALGREEAEGALAELLGESEDARYVELSAAWGNILLPLAYKDLARGELLEDGVARARILDDLFGELTEEVLLRSTLGALLMEERPHIIVDCVNTATVMAYQNMFESSLRLRTEALSGSAGIDAVERHLTTLHLPQLIRHVQILLEATRRVGTLCYVKVGTSGTGGMGLNIPFTHSEERPSRVLLSKAAVAGAHSLLLYLMARTQGAPAVKEIKPTAAISWKKIAFGHIRRGGQPISRFDSTRPVPLQEAFGPAAAGAYHSAGGHVDGVYLDAGENGSFSIGEFETLTALGLMEFITPEEVAEDVLREIRGYPTGHDIVSALDAFSAGPSYRAGVLREVALERMQELEERHGVHAVAYEMLGPPRLSKLLFEAAILERMYPRLTAAAGLEPGEAASRAAHLIESDADLRVRIVSIGLPILLPDGHRLLRGPEVKVAPAPEQRLDPTRAARLADNGWVDLRPENWRRWRHRAAAILKEENAASPDEGSRSDTEPARRAGRVRPGRMAAWVFRHEDRGGRIRR